MLHENSLLADDSHEISYFIIFENKEVVAKLYIAVMIDDLRINEMVLLNTLTQV